MLQYKFNNGVLLKTHNMNDNYRVAVDGKIVTKYNYVLHNYSSKYIFFENAKDVKVFLKTIQPSVARLVNDTLMLDTEISTHQYYLMDQDIRSLYELTDEVEVEEEVKYSYVETGVDFLGEPSNLREFFKKEGVPELNRYTPERFKANEYITDSKYVVNSWSYLSAYVPVTVEDRDIISALKQALINKGAVTNILNGEGTIEVYAPTNEITVKYYEESYKGEMERYEICKQDGRPYANPRYRERRKRPNQLREIKLSVPYDLIITGENSFDLANKINKLAEEFLQ